MPKFIEFVPVPSDGKTKIINIYSKSQNTILGKIKWFGPWRKYCFFPFPDTIFDTTCLTDINEYIHNLSAGRG